MGAGPTGSGASPRDRGAGDTAPAGGERGLGRSLLPNTIRGKLFLVFGIIFVSAAISALIAERANIIVQEQLSSITEENLPSVVTAYKVSEAMTNIRTVAAAMATAGSEAALASRRALLSRQIGETQELITELGGTGVGSETASTLEEYVGNVDAMTRELAKTVEERLRLSGLLNDRIQVLADQHHRFNSSIEPLISRELALLGAESERVATHTTESLRHLNDISFKGLIPILSINVELARMQESLAGASTAGSEAMLDTYWGEFVRSSSVISRNIEEIKSNASAEGVIDSRTLTEHFDRIMRLSVGDGGIFETVRREFADGANLQASIGNLVSDLEESFVAFERQVRLSITLIRGQTVNVGVDLNRQVSESLVAIKEASVDGYGALLELEALGNRAVGLLSVAAFAENKEALGILRRQFEALENEAAAALARLQTGADLSATTGLVGRLVDFGEGQAGIFSLRENELRALERVEDLLFRTNALTLRMSTIAAEIVTDAHAMTDTSLREGGLILGIPKRADF